MRGTSALAALLLCSWAAVAADTPPLPKVVSGVPSAFRAVMVKVSACPAMGALVPGLTARLGLRGSDHSSLPWVPSLAANSSVPLAFVRPPGKELLGTVQVLVSVPP